MIARTYSESDANCALTDCPIDVSQITSSVQRLIRVPISVQSGLELIY